MLQRSAERDAAEADTAESNSSEEDSPGEDGAGPGAGDGAAAADDGNDEPEPCPSCDGSGVASGDPAPFLRPPVDLSTVDPRRLLPSAILYVHLHESALETGEGVARMEGVGPVTIDQVRRFLGHTDVRPVQVVDVAGQEPVDGYEVPARIRQALHLRGSACVFPWATNVSRKKDAEHVKPYVPRSRGGPPGQTSMANLGWVSRFPHRLKTHGRWRLREPTPGVFEWRSPHGYWWRVDHDGTRYLGREREPGRPPDAGPATEPAAVADETTNPGDVPSPPEQRFAELVARHGRRA